MVSKGVFIEGITVEMLRNASLEAVETLLNEGYIEDVEIPRWIPCSKRLPEYDETSEYLVTDKGGRVRHCLLDPYMPETFVTVEEGMIVDAVAWRPAPEPYCKTESHEREVE